MFREYIVRQKKQELEDTFLYTLQPKDGGTIVDFLPGQYTLLKNPSFHRPEEEHPFSIASSPLQQDVLEFCIKTYGDWTAALTQAEIGQTLFVGTPRGNFLWDNTISYAIFMLGGIGISPIMSMLRYIQKTNQHPKIVILYGNRTPDTVAYRNELHALQENMADFTIIDIFSHLHDSHPWEGYRGFITPDIVRKEVALSLEPTFFTIGPPIFIQKMMTLLDELGVQTTRVKTEDLSQK